MRIKVDKASDALCFRLDESRIVDSEENDQVVAVEFLRISARASNEELSSIHFQTI